MTSTTKGKDQSVNQKSETKVKKSNAKAVYNLFMKRKPNPEFADSIEKAMKRMRGKK